MNRFKGYFCFIVEFYAAPLRGLLYPLFSKKVDKKLCLLIPRRTANGSLPELNKLASMLLKQNLVLYGNFYWLLPPALFMHVLLTLEKVAYTTEVEIKAVCRKRIKTKGYLPKMYSFVLAF